MRIKEQNIKNVGISWSSSTITTIVVRMSVTNCHQCEQSNAVIVILVVPHGTGVLITKPLTYATEE